MNRKPKPVHVTIRCNEDDRRRWNDFVRNNEQFASLSHWVRWLLNKVSRAAKTKAEKAKEEETK